MTDAEGVRSANGRHVQLAGQTVGESRHICAFFRDRDEADRALVPFVVEGLARGEYVVFVVGQADQRSIVPKLEAAGIDVSKAEAAGQLRIEAWESTYLRGGRFDQTAMLGLILGILARGRADGFARSRYVADMAWTLLGKTSVGEVIDYEGRLDRALRRTPDIVVCAYDLRQFAAPVVVDILAAHRVALVEGSLKETRGRRAGWSARDRILDAANRLFHAQGIQQTSVDTVIAAADVAKATLYRHFPTKDDLVLGWLEDARPRWFNGVRVAAESRAGSDPRAVPLALFGAIADWLVADDFRGCPYLNASVEIVDRDSRSAEVIQAFLDDIEGQLASILRAAGEAEPEQLAGQLRVLIAGSISLAVSHRTTTSVMAARDAAARLLKATEQPRSPTRTRRPRAPGP